MRRQALAVLSVLLAGCVGNPHVHAPHPPPASIVTPPAPVRVRAHLAWRQEGPGTTQWMGERTAAFGVPMGEVLMPEGADTLHELVVRELRALGCQVVPDTEPADVTLDGETLELRVQTPATLLYWDVIAGVRISLALREASDTAHVYAAERRERTWSWPGKAIMARVLDAALDDVRQQVRSATSLQAALARAASGARRP